MRPVAIVAVLLVSVSAHAGPLWGVLPAIREELELHTDRATAACARSERAPRTVTLRITAEATTLPRYGTLAIEPVGDDPFAACVARELREHHRILGAVPQRIATTVTLMLPPPARVLARAVDDVFDRQYFCMPKPGVVPDRVRVDIEPDDGIVAVTATTGPSNPAIDRCIAVEVHKALFELGVGASGWMPHLHLTKTLGPVVSPAELRLQVDFLARDAAVTCYGPTDAVPSVRVRVEVTATRDADDFAIVVRSGDEERDTCILTDLRERLRGAFRQPVDDPDYFRIDGDARVSITFGYESEARHAARSERYYQRQYRDSLGE